MTNTPRRLSFGSAALILALALPMGFLSVVSGSTTAEQIDAAIEALVGRVTATQTVQNPVPATYVRVLPDHRVFGPNWPGAVTVAYQGTAPVKAGDDVLMFIGDGEPAVLGTYLLHKDDATLDYEVLTPVTGMLEQGIFPGDQLFLDPFEQAILAHRGLAGGGGGGGGVSNTTGIPPDDFEDNDTIDTGTPVDPPVPGLMTGTPLYVSPLTITQGDVDFFTFHAGPVALLHASTGPIGDERAPDTLIGVFDPGMQQLLAWDDDGGPGSFSVVTALIEKRGDYAVAVESAPDGDLDFSGDEGETTGFYSLKMQLELGKHITNVQDMVAGVSPDGTFIEDLVGVKLLMDDEDVLLAGMEADAFGVRFGLPDPQGVTSFFGGGGEQLTDPGFTSPMLPLSFAIGSVTDSAGYNRRGLAESSVLIVASGLGEGGEPEGVLTSTQYTISVGSRIIKTRIGLQGMTSSRIDDVLYTRVLDVDLFGEGDDHFFWSFNPSSSVKAFAVDTSQNVGNLVAPVLSVGDTIGDMQAALVIDHGDVTNRVGTTYPAGFTYENGHPSEMAALSQAQRNLGRLGLTTWVIAVDEDPDDPGTFSAFGAGLAAP